MNCSRKWQYLALRSLLCYSLGIHILKLTFWVGTYLAAISSSKTIEHLWGAQCQCAAMLVWIANKKSDPCCIQGNAGSEGISLCKTELSNSWYSAPHPTNSETFSFPWPESALEIWGIVVIFSCFFDKDTSRGHSLEQQRLCRLERGTLNTHLTPAQQQIWMCVVFGVLAYHWSRARGGRQSSSSSKFPQRLIWAAATAELSRLILSTILVVKLPHLIPFGGPCPSP